MSNSAASKVLSELREYDRELQLLKHGCAVLQWDQETYMPPAAAEERAEQLGVFETLVHDRIADDRLGELLELAGASPNNLLGSEDLPYRDRALIRLLFREHLKARRVPRDLVGRLARAASAGQTAWRAARAEDDFAAFKPQLEELVALAQERAECLGYEEHPYDALLDQYEPHMTTAEVSRVFHELEQRLVPLVSRIAEAPQLDDTFLYREFPEDIQETFGARVLREIGWPSNRGRLDISTHPFTIGLGRDDVRITTRYDRGFFNAAFFSMLHEAGHGLYELGFADEIRGSMLADGTSLGIHESQSRFWENVVGRSRAFWKRYYPALQGAFPTALAEIDYEAFYRAINKVRPSLIRVEADEVTYSLHVILRFRLETALFSGDLASAELPDAWREESRRLLGVVPESDAEGVLQDVHWSMGGFGYFPTYALGNLFAAQFTEALEAELGPLAPLLERGEFAEILAWLRQRIHAHGSARTATELVSDITGRNLEGEPFMRYLHAKFGEIYALD